MEQRPVSHEQDTWTNGRGQAMFLELPEPCRRFVLRRLLVTLAAASILAPLALAHHGSAATGDAPEWHVGQTWTYRGYLAAPGPAGNVTTTLTVVRVDSTSALLRTEEVWDEFGPFVAETLFSLPEFTIVASNTTVPNGQHYDSVYDPPLRLFSFPLAAENAWQSPTFLGTYEYRVLPRTEVTTPAGVPRQADWHAASTCCADRRRMR